MAYASWSVVFGEQPSAAKWNILGTNDSTFNTLLGTYGVKNPYCFRAIDSGGTTLTDATHVQIALATEVYDYNNNFASSTYTAPVAGVYHFDGGVTITGNVATGVSFWCSVWVDGAEYIRGPRITPGNNNGVGVSADVPLTVGQAVTLRGYQDSAGNEATETGTGATFFNGHLIHAV